MSQPTKAGFWWAKSVGYKWFNLIVRVSGDAPFLTLEAWDMGLKGGCGKIDPSDVASWGPQICDPDDLMENADGGRGA